MVFSCDPQFLIFEMYEYERQRALVGKSEEELAVAETELLARRRGLPNSAVN